MSHSDFPNDRRDHSASALRARDTMWLHGAGLAGDTWGPITASYPRAQTPDLPGHGLADMAYPPRVETYADAVQGRVQPGTVLIGHSLGGMVALELAARLQNRISALILIEAVPTVRDRLSGRLSARIATGLVRIVPQRALAWLSGLGHSAETRTELRRQMAATDRARLTAVLEAAAQYDGRPRLPQISVPTLVIVGQKNTATHHGATLMADRIAGAELERLPGGHMLHTDNPVQLRHSIERFLNRVGLH
ncbi:alpha/beta fold hydrolase [uncultured Tateyamaria sp.]|uniref:alpha/beta fold hydrolase n=1 Tax=Tateyamaria sp. 1078 TaxID=3417464 RepID=UPI00260E23C5|nr:alpha/beta fold hydrolase [uncultured Tateyamaria sp.]